MKIDIDKLVRSNVKALLPYSTARDEYKGDIGVYLDANENPYDNGYNRYPDPRQEELKKKLSTIKGIPVENLFIGNGSDEPIDLLYRVFCIPGEDNAVIVSPSYGMYSVAADINNIKTKEVYLDENFMFSKSDVQAAIDDKTKLVFFCSPNNPSGNLLCREDIVDIALNNNVIIVVDEAYIDFADCDSISTEMDKYSNIVVLQTLSKAWGMAAVRCGIAIASQQILSYMNKIKYPYNINKLTQEWVIKQLDNIAQVKEQVAIIKSERARIITEISKFDFVKKVYPSDANFILVKVDDAHKYYDLLINKEIIVRNRSKVIGCSETLRITIGTPEENQRLLDTLSNIQ